MFPRMEIHGHCPDCVDAPVYWVSAGKSPEPNALVRTCADEGCIDDARRWVEQATGLGAEVAAIGVAEVA